MMSTPSPWSRMPAIVEIQQTNKLCCAEKHLHNLVFPVKNDHFQKIARESLFML